MPVRRLQASLIILALLGAAGALFPWADRYRFTSAALAFAIIFTVLILARSGPPKARQSLEQRTQHDRHDRAHSRIPRHPLPPLGRLTFKRPAPGYGESRRTL